MPSPEQDAVTLLADLSPVSRRRHQKRLHMRRKRASMSGVTAIDDGLEYLKPGRKRAKRFPFPEDKTQGGLECIDEEGDTVSAHKSDGSGPTQKRYPRAKQMAIDELRDLGLAAEDLRRSGVDVLNPEGVAKMLKYVARYSTSPMSIITRSVYGINYPEPHPATVREFRLKPSGYLMLMWPGLLKTWSIVR
jgi:hypothetical protein